MARLDIKMLTPMDAFETMHPLKVELAYAREDNHLFGERIYREDARLWLHKDLAEIVCRAAQDIHDQYGWTCILYDGLRTIDAQARMLETQRVRDNPHWLEEPRLLSPPGAGAHPRGMAIDIGLEDADGALIDMGCPFDDLTEKAHRDYPHATEILNNRAVLCDAMVKAAGDLGCAILPLQQEWWDFRFPPDIYEGFEPISDSDLPADMRLL